LALSLVAHASNSYSASSEKARQDKSGRVDHVTDAPSFAGTVAGPAPALKTAPTDTVANLSAPKSVTVYA
jgi:hypothetical protein